MFSADFRRAVSAEAAGDYSEAARAYALAGEHAKVAEMHLLRSERVPSPEGKLQELRAAIRWADPQDPDGRAARRRIARALYQWARQMGVVSEADQKVVREAAALFESASDFGGAGECYELIGDELAAAEAYQKAGEVERLEAVLAREEARRKKRHRVSEAYEEHRLKMASGERDVALVHLRACVEEATGAEQTGFRHELEVLEGRLLTGGQVALKMRRATAPSHEERRYVGGFPVVLGREATCQIVLRDAGVSRRHVEIASDGEDGFRVRDLGSRNGTTLGGVAIGAALPLPEAGELGIGEVCVIGFAVRREAGRAVLSLTVARGLDRGLTIEASAHPLELPGGAVLRFSDGRPFLAPAPGRVLLLGGHQVAGPVQLIRGDVVEAMGGGEEAMRYEVADGSHHGAHP
jgi:hypothetical protein